MTSSPGRIHHVSCGLISGPEGSASFAEAERLSSRLVAYAQRLGFGVMAENVDDASEHDPLSTVLADLEEVGQ